jgi:putative metallohydrolase (TIGR04338 family)
MERVTQQFTLYRAERDVPRHLRGPRFTSQEEIGSWVVRHVLNTPWWELRFPHIITIECPTVKRGHTGSCGGVVRDGVGVIEMAPEHWEALFVLHEIAHVVVEEEGSVSHDPIFARTYLELVYRVLGLDSWVQLRYAFVYHNICFDERCMELPTCQCSHERR